MSEKPIVVSKPVQTQMFADMDKKPISLRKEMEKLGLLARHIKAKDLIGETFIVFKAKPFSSKYEQEFEPYFCHCTDLKHEEVWTTVLGGQAVTEILANYIALNTGKPIQITLLWVEGGSHDGYFVIE